MVTVIFSLVLLVVGPVAATAANPLPCWTGYTVQTDSLPYNLQNPSVVINLVSEDLKEISGLSPTDEPGIFCAIADERGEIFFIDGNGGGAIVQRVLFRDKGDFEGVEKVGKCLYAAKSNGDVFEMACWEKNNPQTTVYKTSITKTDNVEGLCYDSLRNALLIACKGEPDSAYLRKVYAFDLGSKQLIETPVFTVDPLEVNRLVAYSDEDKAHFFSPSGIAVHPLNGDVYIVSSALKRLVVLDYKTGKIRFAVRLNKKLLPQPEGIAFDRAGNLYLSSEGKQGEGLLYRFDFLKQY